jgi:ArsR family transcriptional regulator, arsenate/arsenite/antimonite-responsive transcriptional repressor
MAKQLSEMEALFKALADATRLRILGLLLAGEVCVCDIHESLKIPQSKASRHLAYLRKSGLVETRREGLWVRYRLGTFADPVLAAIGDAVRHALTHVEIVHRDAGRLQKRTGCCLPNPGDVARLPCCAPQTVSASANVTRTPSSMSSRSGRESESGC